MQDGLLGETLVMLEACFLPVNAPHATFSPVDPEQV